MVGQPLDVLGQAVRVERLDRRRRCDRVGAPPFLEQAAVRHVVGQRVLERVLRLGIEADGVEQLGRLEPREGRLKLAVRQIGDGPQQRERHVLADHGWPSGAVASPRAAAGRCGRPGPPGPWPGRGCPRRGGSGGTRLARRPGRRSPRVPGRSPPGRRGCPRSWRPGAPSEAAPSGRAPAGRRASPRRSPARAGRSEAGCSSSCCPRRGCTPGDS